MLAGQLVQRERSGAIQHGGGVQAGDGQRGRARAGGDDDLVGLDLLVHLFAFDGDQMRAEEAAVAVQHGDVGLACSSTPTPPTSCLTTLVLCACIAGQSILRRADAARRTLPRSRTVSVHLGAVQERLGRDAADVEADAAQLFALHQHDLRAQLGRAQRRDIAARAAADHGNICFQEASYRRKPDSRLNLEPIGGTYY